MMGIGGVRCLKPESLVSLIVLYGGKVRLVILLGQGAGVSTVAVGRPETNRDLYVTVLIVCIFRR